MTFAYPLWWLALPVLLLPVWWHRQKRRRTQAEALATARFLPAAPPRQMRVWRWDDVPLLLLRSLLLVALIAWLAVVVLPWRGDTIVIAADVPAAWADQQAAQAGMAGAQRLPLAAEPVLPWLQAHEHEWRKDAKLLVLARQVAMPAQMPKLAHSVDIRIAPAAAAVKGNATPAPAALQVALVTTPQRKAAWRALFAAFDAAGNGTVRHTVMEFDGSEAPPTAALMIWDRATPPPANWNAPLWWTPSLALPLFPGVDKAAVQTLRINGLPLQVAHSPRGRLWASDAWPPNDADNARTLYDTWHALHFAPQAWPLPPQVVPAQRSAPLPMPGHQPDHWLAYALLTLFILERLMTHARRR